VKLAPRQSQEALIRRANSKSKALMSSVLNPGGDFLEAMTAAVHGSGKGGATVKVGNLASKPIAVGPPARRKKKPPEQQQAQDGADA